MVIVLILIKVVVVNSNSSDNNTIYNIYVHTVGVLAVLRKDITLEDLAYGAPYCPSLYLGRRCSRAPAAKATHIAQVQEGTVSARSLALSAVAVRYERGPVLLLRLRAEVLELCFVPDSGGLRTPCTEVAVVVRTGVGTGDAVVVDTLSSG